MDAEAAVAEALQRFQDRLDNLRVLLATLEHHACFDEEDRGWVVEAIEGLERQREDDEEAMQRLLLQTAELEERQALVRERHRVLSSLDTETRCLKDNKRLFRKFVAKQRALEAAITELQERRDALLHGSTRGTA
jgi:streptomycin 6-kinase